MLQRVLDSADGRPPDDPLERSDRVDALAGWLGDAGAEAPWDLAEALADVGLEREALESTGITLAPRQQLAVVRWVAEACRARKLLGEVRSSAARISDIVRALKGYSHMDRASEQRVDVVAGIEDTLVMLRAKLAGIRVERAFDTDLPEVWGNAGELNQVWTNLIANAAEALDGSGAITLRVRATAEGVRVDVEDDGPGIAPDLVDRVFDPFVTTKPPGEGTGLGLNLVHGTIVERHHGSVTVESRPGCTCFTVTLPAQRSERDG
jgi:signal transduction histidine kinase